MDVVKIVCCTRDLAPSLEGFTTVRGARDGEDVCRAAKGSESRKDAAVLKIRETGISATSSRVQNDCVGVDIGSDCCAALKSMRCGGR